MYEIVVFNLLYFLAIVEPIFCNYVLLPLCLLLNSQHLAYIALLPRYGKLVLSQETKFIIPLLVECVAYSYIIMLPQYYILDVTYVWFIINIGRVITCGSLPLYTTWSLFGCVIHIVFFSWLTLPFTMLRLISEII